MVLAHGSWGTIAGRTGATCNKGNPPCIGVGLMRKLAKRFVVAITPEQYTSKTCCRCMGAVWSASDDAKRGRRRDSRLARFAKTRMASCFRIAIGRGH